jgi:hypothetical protein
MERQLVGVMSRHHRGRSPREPRGGQAYDPAIDEMGLGDLDLAAAEHARERGGGARILRAAFGAQRKRRDAELAHVLLKVAGDSHAADDQAVSVQPAALDQGPEVGMGPGVADDVQDRDVSHRSCGEMIRAWRMPTLSSADIPLRPSQP